MIRESFRLTPDSYGGPSGQVRMEMKKQKNHRIVHNKSTYLVKQSQSYNSTSLVRFPILSGIDPYNPGFEWMCLEKIRSRNKKPKNRIYPCSLRVFKNRADPINKVTFRSMNETYSFESSLSWPILSGIWPLSPGLLEKSLGEIRTSQEWYSGANSKSYRTWRVVSTPIRSGIFPVIPGVLWINLGELRRRRRH